MASANAIRQRRHRAHKRGDHSLCLDPDRCASEPVLHRDGVTRDVPTGPSVPPGLAGRGRRLWSQLTADGLLAPPELVLLEEACRLADRLDRLDAILNGDAGEWMRFRVNDDGTEVTVTLDRALSEARQQQVALKALLGELRASRAAGTGAPRRGQGGQARTSGTGATARTKEGGGVLVDLSARIAGRQTAG